MAIKARISGCCMKRRSGPFCFQALSQERHLCILGFTLCIQGLLKWQLKYISYFTVRAFLCIFNIFVFFALCIGEYLYFRTDEGPFCFCQRNDTRPRLSRRSRVHFLTFLFRLQAGLPQCYGKRKTSLTQLFVPFCFGHTTSSMQWPCGTKKYKKTRWCVHEALIHGHRKF